MRTFLRRCCKIALIILCFVLLLEVSLRIAGHYYRKQFWTVRLGNRSFQEEDIVILAIGESTTAGLWVPRKHSYPKQLERLLRAHYKIDRIHVVIPPHIGQNTSQVLQHFDIYIEKYHPALVIIMAGVNNKWSLAQSNLGKFMPSGRWKTLCFRIRRWSDNIKVVRLFRLLFPSSHEKQNTFRDEMEGRPRYTAWPPKSDPLVQGIGPEPFLRLWRFDVGKMIEASKATGTDVILMTYPNYDDPPISEFYAMSKKWSIPLVENHKSFTPFIEEGKGEKVFCSDFHHPNAKGYAIVADNVFDCIVRMGTLDHELTVR